MCQRNRSASIMFCAVPRSAPVPRASCCSMVVPNSTSVPYGMNGVTARMCGRASGSHTDVLSSTMTASSVGKCAPHVVDNDFNSFGATDFTLCSSCAGSNTVPC